MSYAAIELDFHNVALTGVEYLMRTAVDINSIPYPEIMKCLVVTKGDASTEERLSRVATYSEFTGISALPELPDDANQFSSALYPSSLSVNDVINLTTPNKWLQLHNAPALFDVIVIDDSNPGFVVVTPTTGMVDLGFLTVPSFARGLEFTVNSGVDVFLDGLLNRDYSAYPVGINFRALDHDDTWLELKDAQAAFNSLPGEAQGLVDDLNEDRWSGTYTKRFE